MRLGFEDPFKNYTRPMSLTAEMRPVFHDSGETQWNQINSIPIYDDNGQLTGAFGLIRNISGMMEKQVFETLYSLYIEWHTVSQNECPLLQLSQTAPDIQKD